MTLRTPKITDEFEKTLLTRWAMRTLNWKGLHLYDVKDINGYHLINMVEILLEKPLHSVEPLDPYSNADKEASIQEAFDFIRQNTVESLDLPEAREILTNKDLIFDIIFIIFFHFERFGNEAENAKESLLKWTKNSLTKKIYEKVKIDDFGKSWSNGLAFCALIHQFNPKSIKFEKLSPFESDANIRLGIYATNVLLNFDDLLNFNNYTESTENGKILIVSELYSAFKNAPKMGISKEIITETIDVVREIKNCETKTKAKSSILGEKLRNVRSKLKEHVSKLPNSNLEETKEALRTTKELGNLRKEIFDLEKNFYTKFLCSLKVDSEKILRESQKDIGESDYFELFNESKNLGREIENYVFRKQGEEQETAKADKKHLLITKELIKWTESIRGKMDKDPLSKDTSGIINEINCHMALNLEINTKRNSSRDLLSKIEDRLEKVNYIGIANTRERISVDAMFSVVSNEWVAKLAKLREHRVKVENGVRLVDLYKQHENIASSIEKREENFYFKYCCEYEVKNLLDAKRCMFRLKYEKDNNKYFFRKDEKTMETLETQIKPLSKTCLPPLNVIDETVFKDAKAKLAEIKKRTEERYEESSKKLSDLIARELCKERVNIMIGAHSDTCQELLQWCSDQRDVVDAIECDDEKIEEALNDIQKLNECKTALKHKMKLELNHLKSLGEKITNSSFKSKDYPQHLWRFNSDSDENFDFKEQREEVFVALADLADQCEAKSKMASRKLKVLEEKDNWRTQFSAVVGQLKLFIEQRTLELRASTPNFKIGHSDFERKVELAKEDILAIEDGSDLLLEEAEKKYEKCDEMGGTSDLSSDIITKIRKMHDDFAILLRVTKERVEAETSKLKSKENLCKNYAKEIKNALEKMQKMLIESATMQKSNDVFCFEKEKTFCEKSLQEIEKLTEKVSSLENELLENDISFNPFSANRLEDLNQWSKLTEDALKRKLKLVEQILTCSKLNSLSLFEVENLHKNYSKHFDSKKNGYLDKKALNQCLSDLGADFDDSEIDDIFDKNGVRSKKTPNLKLLSFKKFSDFFNRAGSVRSRRKILESFANLNNGVPFVTKRQLATKLSLNDLNFVENEIKMATDNNEKLFFSKWIEKVFEGEPKERTATNLENRKEKTIKKLFLKKRKSVL